MRIKSPTECRSQRRGVIVNQMMIILYAFITNALVRSVTFSSRILSNRLQNPSVNVQPPFNMPPLDSSHVAEWETLLTNLPRDNLNKQLDNILESGRHLELQNALGYTPYQLADQAIAGGNFKAIQDLARHISTKFRNHHIEIAFRNGRSDMIVELAKYGDANSVSLAFQKLFLLMKTQPAFLKLLLTETRHISGSSDAAYKAYVSIMGSNYKDKMKVVNTFISIIETKDIPKYLQIISFKNEVLLKRASKRDKRIVQLFAESKELNAGGTLDYLKAFGYFAKKSDWEFILKFSSLHPVAVSHTIFKYAHSNADRARLFQSFLIKINSLEESPSLINVYRSVAVSGDTMVMSIVLQKLKNEIKAGEKTVSDYTSKFSTGSNQELFQRNPSPEYWIILEGIEDAAKSKQYDMVRYLVKYIDASSADNLALQYLVHLNDVTLVKILLKEPKVMDTNLKGVILSAPRETFLFLKKNLKL